MNIDKHSTDLPIIEVRRFLAEYQFFLEGITFARITIRLYEVGDRVEWEQSHYIKTPEQLDPYSPSRTSEDSEEAALNGAIASLTSYYETAVRKGHKPDDDWLVPNAYFAK